MRRQVPLTVLSEVKSYVTKVIAGKIRTLAIFFEARLSPIPLGVVAHLHTSYTSARGERGNAIDRVTNDAWSDYRDRIVRTNRRQGGRGKTNPTP